jgi:hypothetical protein
MALDIGDTTCTHGLSKRIADAWLAAGTTAGFAASPTAGQLAAVHALAFAIASGIVNELATNGVVTTVISTGTGSLQTSTTPGSATNAPAAPQTLTGSIS